MIIWSFSLIVKRTADCLNELSAGERVSLSARIPAFSKLTEFDQSEGFESLDLPNSIPNPGLWRKVINILDFSKFTHI